MALTQKQENFCMNVVKGMSYSDAYRQAYNVEKMKPATITNSAYKLLKNGDITARINELKGKIEEKLIYSALDSFNKLTEIQTKALNHKKIILGKDDCIEVGDPDYSSAIKAEELKGKLAQLYTEKKEITFSGDLKERADEIRRRLFETDKD